MNKNDIKEILKIGLILFLITAVSATLLAAVNTLTSPIIEANNQAKRYEAMKKVMPGAENFEKVEFLDEGLSVTEVYSAFGMGYVVLAEPKGYGGAISLVVGVDDELTVTGIDITNQSETPGLGANCQKPDFMGQFKGKTSGITVVKGTATGNQIDAITSSTVTSKAVTKGVNDALLAAEIVKEGK